MRGSELLDKMELIDSAYVEAADAEPKRNRIPLKWGTLAACFLVACLVGIKFLLPYRSVDSPRLPMLSITEKSEGMGFEGYMAHDISELVNANPWKEDLNLSALPVYKNKLQYDENHFNFGFDSEKMRPLLIETAEKLGLDTKGLKISDDAPDEKTKQQIIKKYQAEGAPVPDGFLAPSSLILSGNDVKIEVDSRMTTTISFDPERTLPKKYNFSDYAAFDDMAAVAEYLKDTYATFIGMENPQVDIFGGHYDIYHHQIYDIAFFDAGKNEIDRIINYNFNRTLFYGDEDGKLFLARIYRPDLSEKMGDYPIIDVKQAKELMMNGHYLTDAPYDFPGEEYIKKVELIYLTGEKEEYYMPYYRFYTELPEEKNKNGLKIFGAYYVPAVEGSYLSNMPTWNGKFNG